MVSAPAEAAGGAGEAGEIRRLGEFWLTALFAGVFVWSAVRDRRALEAEASRA